MDAATLGIITTGAVGVAGLAGSIITALVTQSSTRKRERDQHQRLREDRRSDRQEQLYLDMMGHLEVTDSWIGLLTDQTVDWVDRTVDYPLATTDLSPKVELFCGNALTKSWLMYTFRLTLLRDRINASADRATAWRADHPAISSLEEAALLVKADLKTSAKLGGLS